jgi:hypothetical protein
MTEQSAQEILDSIELSPEDEADLNITKVTQGRVKNSKSKTIKEVRNE